MSIQSIRKMLDEINSERQQTIGFMIPGKNKVKVTINGTTKGFKNKKKAMKGCTDDVTLISVNLHKPKKKQQNLIDKYFTN